MIKKIILTLQAVIISAAIVVALTGCGGSGGGSGSSSSGSGTVVGSGN